VARGSVLVSGEETDLTVVSGEAVTVDIVGSFEAAALSAPLAMSTNSHQGFDTHTRENL
jgi:hypothetical protein